MSETRVAVEISVRLTVLRTRVWLFADDRDGRRCGETTLNFDTARAACSTAFHASCASGVSQQSVEALLFITPASYRAACSSHHLTPKRTGGDHVFTLQQMGL
jgi:hypothetical protein